MKSELTSEEIMLLSRLNLDGPQHDRDRISERVLVNRGLAQRLDPGLIAITEKGRRVLAEPQ